MRRPLSGALTLLLAAAPAMSLAEQGIDPVNNFRVAVNGIFALCPMLVRGAPAPDAAGLSKLGFTTMPSPPPGETRYAGLPAADAVQVRYEAADRRCTTHYSGSGYASVAGVARALLLKNGLTLVTSGNRDGAQGDVYEGPTPGRPARARFIVIENAASHTAAVSYTEKVA